VVNPRVNLAGMEQGRGLVNILKWVVGREALVMDKSTLLLLALLALTFAAGFCTGFIVAVKTELKHIKTK